jgi:mRNA interferase MazF
VIQRGSVVIVSLPGDYGKPRPAVVVQADIGDDLTSRIICPMTSTTARDRDHFRPVAGPSAQNGLREVRQIIDKPHVLPIQKLGGPIGTLEAQTMAEVNIALMLLLGLA